MSQDLALAPPVSPTIPSDVELIQRARDLGPMLVARQAQTESLGRYPEDVHEAFRDAGFYRMLMPKRFGGYECDLQTYFTILREVSRNCPSTGWMFGLTVNHTVTVASFFSEEAQAEIFAGEDFLAPLTAKPAGTATPTGDGGWELTGTFSYNTGAPYSTHMLAHAMSTEPLADGSPGGPMLFIAPRSQYEVLEDWGNVLGLKGSGSNSIRFDGGRVPAHFAMPGQTFLSLTPADSVGFPLHGNPMYAGSTNCFYLIDAANVATGILKGAMDVYEEYMTTKQTPIPPFPSRAADEDYQRWFGRVMGQLATAEAALDHAADTWVDLSTRQAWTPEEDLRLTGLCREVIYNLVFSAMAGIIRTTGSSAIRNGERMERAWRDFTQLYSHGSFFLYDMAARGLSQERVGRG